MGGVHRHTGEYGEAGRRRLREARVLLVGAGGLGAPAAIGLAAAGVGSIVIVDFDRVDESNLQRQVLFETADVGRSKVEATRTALHRLTPAIDVEVIDEPFGVDNAARLVTGVDLVVDGTDNFGTRYLVNDACVMGGRPNVFGSVSRFDGQVAVFAAPGGPCYRCLHPDPPPEGAIQNCAEGGVLGVLPGVIGSLQAVEAVKVLAGVGEPLVGRLLIYEALRMRARDIVLPRDPRCPVCGEAPTIRTLQRTDVLCAAPVDAAAVIDSATLADWRRRAVAHLLIDVREPSEQAAGIIEGARLVPLGRIAEVRPSLPRDRPVIVYCRTGLRSARAASLLRDSGVDARSLTGGIEAWRAAVPAETTGG